MLTNLVEQVKQGTKGHAECIEIGNGIVSSLINTMNQQSEEACKKIKAHPIFGNRQFNILGLSQGSLIGRYIVETCDLQYPVYNLVTVGGPNNGVDFEQNCNDQNDNTRCEVQKLINKIPMVGLYSKIVQSTVGPSNYFRDHTKM